MLGLKRETHLSDRGNEYNTYYLADCPDKTVDFIPVKTELVEYEKDGQQKQFRKYFVETSDGFIVDVKVGCKVEEKSGKQIINKAIDTRNQRLNNKA